MWTATIQSIDKREGSARLVVALSNGIEKFTYELVVNNQTPSLEWLKAQLRGMIEKVENVYTFADTLPVGTPIDLTPELVAMTPEEEKKQQFLLDISRLRSLKQAVELGIITETDKDYVDLKSRVGTTFEPAYATSI